MCCVLFPDVSVNFPVNDRKTLATVVKESLTNAGYRMAAIVFAERELNCEDFDDVVLLCSTFVVLQNVPTENLAGCSNC